MSYYVIYRAGSRNELCTIKADSEFHALQIAGRWFDMPRGSVAVEIGAEGYMSRLAKESTHACRRAS